MAFNYNITHILLLHIKINAEQTEAATTKQETNIKRVANSEMSKAYLGGHLKKKMKMMEIHLCRSALQLFYK